MLIEAVNSIDFMHSSWLARSTTNNLTGRTRHPHRYCPISANSIALQLVQNGVYKTKNFESVGFVMQELFELWRKLLTNVSQQIFFEKILSVPHKKFLKSGKFIGSGSICPKLILYAGAALNSSLKKLLSSSIGQLKLTKIWRSALVVAIPKQIS